MLITGICYLGNISRTQNVKKDKISFPFTSIVLLSIIKLPTVIFARYQERPQH